ncbi:MAG: hypothetical protein IPI46_08495 [Bacteroidetes bacterium]|nr:hypothetical protein [Bacteroidota bacterium]
MKNRFLILLAIGGLFTSCSTKFNVGAEYKEVSVVYGLLSVSDTAHYIKITKGYFDENQNNLALALNTDSLYFKNLQVSMVILDNGNPIETLTLNRVDLTDEGYPKATGVFGTLPNYAYKFKRNLDATKTFRLKIKNLDTGKEIEAESPLITNAPKFFQFVKPIDDQETLDFSSTTTPFVFRWKGPSTAAFYDVVIEFRYQELDMNTMDTSYVTVDVPIAKSILSGSGEISTSVKSTDFFKQLNSFVSAAPDNIKRYVDTPGLKILGGGSVLKTYIDVNTVQGGITADQIKPNYTNMKGENVFGIFSTRGQIGMPLIKFNTATIESIKNGAFTQNLNFVGISTK